MNQNPEQQARDKIDNLLEQSGWVIQNKNQINLNAGIGIAVREYQTDTGPAENGKVDWDSSPKLNLSNAEYEKYKLTKDDVLITRTGSIGTVSVFNDDKKAIAGAFLINYRLKKPINIKLIFYFLKSQKAQNNFKEFSSGVGRPNLNVPNIELLKIPIPKIAEQDKIVSEIETRPSESDNMEKTIEQSLQQAEALRQSILKMVFEGN